MNYKHFLIILIGFLAVLSALVFFNSEDSPNFSDIFGGRDVTPKLNMKNLNRTIEEFKSKPYESNSFTAMQVEIDGYMSDGIITSIVAEDAKLRLYESIKLRLEADASAHIQSGSSNSALMIAHLNEVNSTIYAKSDPKSKLGFYAQQIKTIDHYCHSMPVIVDAKINDGSLMYDETTVNEDLCDEFIAYKINNLSSIDPVYRDLSRVESIRQSCVDKIENFKNQ